MHLWIAPFLCNIWILIHRRTVKGLHLNFAPPSKPGLPMALSLMLGRSFPKLFGFTEVDIARLYPCMEKLVVESVKETGYMHIQATKPDTAGRKTTSIARSQSDWRAFLDFPQHCLTSKCIECIFYAFIILFKTIWLLWLSFCCFCPSRSRAEWLSSGSGCLHPGEVLHVDEPWFQKSRGWRSDQVNPVGFCNTINQISWRLHMPARADWKPPTSTSGWTPDHWIKTKLAEPKDCKPP